MSWDCYTVERSEVHLLLLAGKLSCWIFYLSENWPIFNPISDDLHLCISRFLNRDIEAIKPYITCERILLFLWNSKYVACVLFVEMQFCTCNLSFSFIISTLQHTICLVSLTDNKVTYQWFTEWLSCWLFNLCRRLAISMSKSFHFTLNAC